MLTQQPTVDEGCRFPGSHRGMMAQWQLQQNPFLQLVSIKHLWGGGKSLAANVNLKLLSQRTFSQGKELLNVSVSLTS